MIIKNKGIDAATRMPIATFEYGCDYCGKKTAVIAGDVNAATKYMRGIGVFVAFSGDGSLCIQCHDKAFELYMKTKVDQDDQ